MISSMVTMAVKDGISSLLKEKARTATAISVITAILGTGETIKATVKAVRLLDDAKEQKGEDLTFKEKAKIVIPEYGLAAALTGASIGSTIFSYSESQRTITQLTGVAAAVTAEYRDFRNQTKLLAGEEKEREIMNAVAQERQERNDILANVNQTVVIDEHEDTWFYEPISGRKFKYSINKLVAGVNNFNFDMFSSMEMDKSLNDLLGLWDQEEMYDTGDDLQFSIDTGGCELVRPFESQVIGDRSYIIIRFRNPPRY